MPSSLELLAVPHPTALKEIVKEALRPGIDATKLLVGKEYEGVGNLMHLPVYVDGAAYIDPAWNYHGSTELSYQRVDLNEALGHLDLGFVTGAMYTSRELVKKISEILQLHFEDEDYIPETRIMQGLSEVYILKADQASKRWMGQVSIRVYR